MLANCAGHLGVSLVEDLEDYTLCPAAAPPELQFRAPTESQAEERNLAGRPWVVLPALPFLDSPRSIFVLLLCSSTCSRVEAPVAHLSHQLGFHCRCYTCTTEPRVGPLYRNDFFETTGLGCGYKM